MLKRIWNIVSFGFTGLMIWERVKAADKARSELYNTLSPEEKAEWDRVFGTPDIAVSNPQLPPVVRKKPADLSQINSGV